MQSASKEWIKRTGKKKPGIDALGMVGGAKEFVGFALVFLSV
jgi:hypothetical protein